jgi:hypothetical protein
MKWLDPLDCKAAREHLRLGDPFEAARVLLHCRQAKHRSVRALLAEVSRALVLRAHDAYEGGQIQAASAAIGLAEQCAALSPVERGFRDCAAAELAETNERSAWLRGRVEMVHRLAEQGHLHLAQETLGLLPGSESLQRLRADLAVQVECFERCLTECRREMDAGRWIAASETLRLARALSPADPRVVQLQDDLRKRGVAPVLPVRAADDCRLVMDRHIRFALAGQALVVSQQHVLIGSLASTSVQVPIQANLRGHHAMISREQHGYRLVPMAGRDTRLNGEITVAVSELNDGSTIEFGSSDCRWRFGRPVKDSTTAVLEVVPPSPARIATPDGRKYTRVVLLDDILDIRPTAPAHIVIPSLPWKALTLRWASDGLNIEGGDDAQPTIGEDSQGFPAKSARRRVLAVPSRLAATSAWGVVQWNIGPLGQVPGLASTILEIVDPNDR